MRTPRHRAFTLVELLVTVGIIVVLVAILVPSLESAIAAARRASCASGQRQLVTGVLAYANDNQLFLPPVSSDGNDLSSVYAPRWFISDNLATPYPADDVVVWGLGFLWYADSLPNSRVVPTPSTAKGYLREPSVYFCPSELHEAFTEETYSLSQTVSRFPAPKRAPAGRDWEPIDESGLPVPVALPTSGVQLPYFYNPIMTNPVTDPTPLFRRVTELDSKKDSVPVSGTAGPRNWRGMLLLDTIERSPDAPNAVASSTDENKRKFSTISHADSPRQALGGWNVSFGDNSTIWTPDARVKAKPADPTAKTTLERIDEAYGNTDPVGRLKALQEIYRTLSGDRDSR